jgi:hypothetical protein
MGRDYMYLADGDTVSATATAAMRIRPLCGIDIRDAMRFRLYGISFAAGETHVPLRWYVRNDTTSANILDAQVDMSFVTGGVARFSSTGTAPANTGRDVTAIHSIIANVTPKVYGPLFLMGMSVDVTAQTRGWVIGGPLMLGGGNSLDENLDDYFKGRENYRSQLWMLRQTMNADGHVLVILHMQNDKSLRTTSASSRHFGGVSGGTSTTLVVDDVTGLEAGMRITVRDASTLGYVDNNSSTSVQNRVIDSIAGNTVAVTVAFTRTPVDGDVWRAAPLGEETPTYQGRLNALETFRAAVSADCLAFGLTPTFLDLPQWPSGTGDSTVLLFEAASATMADRYDDWVSTTPSEEFTVAECEALSGVDLTHPGSYFLSSFLGRFLQQAKPTLASARAGVLL